MQPVVGRVVRSLTTTASGGDFEMSVTSSARQAGCGTKGATVTVRRGGVDATNRLPVSSSVAASVLIAG